MQIFLISLISTAATILYWIIIINFILQFFVPPYHPIRETLDRFIRPMLDPIRRLVPSTGGLDFSPMILIFLVILGERLLVSLIQVIFP